VCIKKLSKGLNFLREQLKGFIAGLWNKWWSGRLLREKVEEVSWGATIIAFVILVVQFCGSNENMRLLRQQTLMLTNVSIYQLADRCVWADTGGDRSSFQTLINLRKQTEGAVWDLIDFKIKEIKRNYKNSEYFVKNLRAVCKAHTKTECEEWEQYDTFDYDNVLGQTTDDRFWTGRAKSAYFLGNKEKFAHLSGEYKQKVLQQLIDRIKQENENSLIVSKTALESFDKLVDDYQIKDNDIFDFQGALEYWQNKQGK